jgi:hypothetical protein
MVFAGKHEQAIANQWLDLVTVIAESACFAPFIAQRTTDTLKLYSPAQVNAGVDDPTLAAVVISAREATPLAGRGPAAFAQLYDEMAHMVPAGSNRSASEIYSAATPALAQFPTESFVFAASSPWTQVGQFYALYQQGLAVDPESHQPLDPSTLVVQLPSAEMYRDWERASEIAAWPGGPTFPPKARPIFADDEHAARIRQQDPDNYLVEYEAQWATVSSAYLTDEEVAGLFTPWPDGQPLAMQERGTLDKMYYAHADPSVSGANFAFAIAHPEQHDGVRHLVVDLITRWQPRDFPEGRIDYEVVFSDIETYLRKFPVAHLTFDQFNSAGMLTRLRGFAHNNATLQRRPMFNELTATPTHNTRCAETFKTAASLGLIHAPYHGEAEMELRFLERRNGRIDHPTHGPVTTSDIADCLMNLAEQLLGDRQGYGTFDNLANTALSASMPGGWHPTPSTEPIHLALGNLGRSSRRSPPPYGAAARGRRYRQRP